MHDIINEKHIKRSNLSVLEIDELVDQISMLSLDEKKSDLKIIIRKIMSNLSALEIKWLVRIILSDLKLGLSYNFIFREYSINAHDIFVKTFNLERVAKSLDDEFFSSFDLVYGEPYKPMLGKRLSAEAVIIILRQLIVFFLILY